MHENAYNKTDYGIGEMLCGISETGFSRIEN